MSRTGATDPTEPARTAYGAVLAYAGGLEASPDGTCATLDRLREPGRWKMLLTRASETGLASLVAKLAETLPAGSVPEQAGAWLAEHRRRCATARTRQDRVFERLPELESAAGSRPIVIKGRVHEALLGERARRLRADVDLMLPASGRVRLGRFLRRGGWKLIGGRAHRAAASSGCGWLALASRHDHWWHPELGDLEVHSRVANDLRRDEWTHARLVRSAQTYGAPGSRFAGPDPRAAAGLALWNALQARGLRHAALAEACALLHAYGRPPEAPAAAETLARWMLAVAIGDGAPGTCDRSGNERRTGTPARRTPGEANEPMLQQAASDAWLGWTARKAPWPVRAVETMRRLTIRLGT